MNEKGFCKHGHDLSIHGRYKSGTCKVCVREGARRNELARRGGRPPIPKTRRFCPKGHDTLTEGRTEGGHCRECHRLYLSKVRNGDHQPRKIAPRVQVDVRYSNGRCRRCEGLPWHRPKQGTCSCGYGYQEEKA